MQHVFSCMHEWLVYVILCSGLTLSPLSIHTLALHVFFLHPGCCDNKSSACRSYEIHLSAEVRNKGLGKFLMQILELIAHR